MISNLLPRQHQKPVQWSHDYRLAHPVVCQQCMIHWRILVSFDCESQGQSPWRGYWTPWQLVSLHLSPQPPTAGKYITIWKWKMLKVFQNNNGNIFTSSTCTYTVSLSPLCVQGHWPPQTDRSTLTVHHKVFHGCHVSKQGVCHRTVRRLKIYTQRDYLNYTRGWTRLYKISGITM